MTIEREGNARGGGYCIACESSALGSDWSVTSAFFAKRALECAPHPVILRHCTECETRYFDIEVTDEQMQKLYAQYRGEEYFQLRHGFEPWYTKALNDGMGSEAEMERRREALLRALSVAGIQNRFTAALDHGGDRGQLLRDLVSSRKAVFDISNVAPDLGVEAVSEKAMKNERWDLVLSCHVLEHLPNPRAYVHELIALGTRGATYFFEVPYEPVRSLRFYLPSVAYNWLKWLCLHPGLLKLFDYLSTGIYGRLGVVIPLCFFPLREHLSFFSIRGLTAMLEKQGLDVHFAGRMATGHIGVVAKRK